MLRSVMRLIFKTSSVTPDFFLRVISTCLTTTLNVIGRFKHSFKCDWLIELYDNKLSNKNLASKLVKNRGFLKPITIEEIVTFRIRSCNQYITTAAVHTLKVIEKNRSLFLLKKTLAKRTT